MFSRLAVIVLEPDARVATGLLLTIIALLPAEPLFNVPLIALAALGGVRLIAGRARLGSLESRFLVVAFLCMWLSMLASLPDAVNPVESIRKTASFCIYFLAGVYVVGAYTRLRELDWVMIGVAAILVFWCLDALWQFVVGTDWFGNPYDEGRLPGPFHHDGRIGSVLAGFSPLFFESVRRAKRRWPWSPVLVVPFLMVIVLSGTRTAWGALAVATIGYLLFLFRWSERPSSGRPGWNLGGIAAVLASMTLAGALTAYAWPGGVERAWKAVEPRVESLTGLWSGDREKFEYAISFRLSIWETAVNMWSANWLNGVGPKGFRQVYRDYNPERDYYHEHLEREGSSEKIARSPRAPHLPLLEIATETGVVGLLGYLILATYFLAKIRRLEREAFNSAFPYALTLIVALFPLNGHMEFYSLFYATQIWWIVIVNAGAFAAASRKGTGSNTGKMTDA